MATVRVTCWGKGGSDHVELGREMLGAGGDCRSSEGSGGRRQIRAC